MITIEDLWKEYWNGIENKDDKSDIEYENARSCFYAGISLFIARIMANVASGPYKECVDYAKWRIEYLKDEVEKGNV